MTKYDVIIIGSGIGGLCCGSLLALSGKKVLISEAHNRPGGVAHGRGGPARGEGPPDRPEEAGHRARPGLRTGGGEPRALPSPPMCVCV